MIKIGITGSIGSGKSTISKMAEKDLGIPVFDADKEVGNIYADNHKVRTFLIEKCGADIIKNGQVDREILKTLMKDPAQKELWDEIVKTVNQAVWDSFSDFAAQKQAEGHKIIIGDVPFLFEQNGQRHFDYSINVFLPLEQQMKRALARPHPKLTQKEFHIRNAAFMPIEQRNKKADFTIDNSGELAASMLQLRAHIEKIKGLEAPAPSIVQRFNESAVYVGSFDPMTLGHVDVVKSAIKMPYKKLYVAIGINPAKKPMFSVDERLAMIEREMDRDVRPLLAPGQEVIVTAYEGLTVDFMKKVNSSFCVRGLRGIKDLEEEADLAAVNRDLFADTLREAGMEDFSQAYFATSRPELRHVSSSFARAICATAEKDLSLLKYVSADVAAKMIAKREENAKKNPAPK